jgi:hypothetical protein
MRIDAGRPSVKGVTAIRQDAGAKAIGLNFQHAFANGDELNGRFHYRLSAFFNVQFIHLKESKASRLLNDTAMFIASDLFKITEGFGELLVEHIVCYIFHSKVYVDVTSLD